jgi:carbon monoxide dehydrogenase subunit G
MITLAEIQKDGTSIHQGSMRTKVGMIEKENRGGMITDTVIENPTGKENVNATGSGMSETHAVAIHHLAQGGPRTMIDLFLGQRLQ